MLDEQGIAEVYKTAKTFAIVGASNNPDRDSNTAVHYLKEQGYNVVPINPKESEVGGEKAYPSVTEAPGPIDVVAVYRRSEDAPAFAREAVEAGAKVVWLPPQVESEEAQRIADEAGLAFIEGYCVYGTHRMMRRHGIL